MTSLGLVHSPSYGEVVEAGVGVGVVVTGVVVVTSKVSHIGAVPVHIGFSGSNVSPVAIVS